MKYNCEIIKNSELFADIPCEKINSMLECFGASERSFAAEEAVLYAGVKVTQIGIVLSGKVYMESCDFWGNKSIITEYKPGASFGEAYALAKNDLPVFDFVAKENTSIVFIDISRLSLPCSKGCAEHKKLVENLLSAVAAKTRELELKMNPICKRTTRDKLISYLSGEARKQDCANIQIPFNRQELADYLSVERCAMSKELHKMKRDGLIDFEGNEFILKLS